MVCDLRELSQQSIDVIENFQRIEPRAWTERVLALELCGEVGSLTYAVLAMEGYKRRQPSLAAVAKHYRFSLHDAYFSELEVCRPWQAKSLASSHWQQRLLRWFGKAR